MGPRGGLPLFFIEGSINKSAYDHIGNVLSSIGITLQGSVSRLGGAMPAVQYKTRIYDLKN